MWPAPDTLHYHMSVRESLSEHSSRWKVKWCHERSKLDSKPNVIVLPPGCLNQTCRGVLSNFVTSLKVSSLGIIKLHFFSRAKYNRKMCPVTGSPCYRKNDEYTNSYSRCFSIEAKIRFSSGGIIKASLLSVPLYVLFPYLSPNQLLKIEYRVVEQY